MSASIARKMGVELCKGRQDCVEAMWRLEWWSPLLNLVRERPKFLIKEGAGDCILRWHAHCTHSNGPSSRREVVAIVNSLLHGTTVW